MKAYTSQPRSNIRKAVVHILYVNFDILALIALALASATHGYAQTPPVSPQSRDAKVDLRSLCNDKEKLATQGQSFSSQLSPGKVQCWSVHLPAQHFMRVEILQEGIDVVVQLYDSQGTPVGGVVDSDNEQDGPEPISQVAEADTDYVLAISSTDQQPRKPNYQIRLVELRRVRPTDRNYVVAERAYLRGRVKFSGGLNIEMNQPAEADKMFVEAVESLNEALPRLDASEERGHVILPQIYRILPELHLRLGLFACGNKNFSKGLEHFAHMRRLSHDSDSAVGEVMALILAKDCAVAAAQPEQERTFVQAANEFDAKYRANALDNIGHLYWSRRDFLKAVNSYQEAVRLYHDLQNKDGEANALTRIGQAYFDLGLFPQARAQWEVALKVEGVTNPVRANTLYNLGVMLSLTGDNQGALSRLTEAEKLFPQEDIEARIYTLHSLGITYATLGKLEEGRDLVARALALNKGGSEKERYLDAAAYEYLYLGYIYQRQGKQQPALENTNKALDIWDKLNDPRGKANALYNIGSASFEQADYKTALQYLERVLPLQEHDPYGRAYTLTSIGTIYSANGNHEEAQKKFEEALNLRSTTGNRQGIVETLTMWARAERARGKLKEGGAILEQAVRQLEELRTQVPGVDLRASYLATTIQVFELRVDVLMQLYLQEGNPKYLEDALALNDSMHARSLLDTVAAAETDSSAELPSTLLDSERKLIDEWGQAVIRHRLLSLSPHTSEQLAEAERNVIRLRTDWQRVRDQIDNNPSHALLRPKLLSPPGFKKLLDRDTVLLEFALGKERSYLWLVSAEEEIKGFELPARRQIETAVHQLFCQIKQSGMQPQNVAKAQPCKPIANSNAAFIEAATALSQMLLGKVANRLATKRLIIVPDGILHYVPFSALTDLAKKNSGKWVPLLNDHEVVVSPSAAVSTILQKRRRERTPAPQLLAVLGDPLYELDAPSGTQSSVRESAAALLGTSEIYLSFLKYEVKEIEKLQKRYAPREEASFLKQEQVYRATATAQSLKNYRIIHYATHGVFDDEDPETSGLLLSLYDEYKRPRLDFFLSLRDVYRMRLGADLVVLSACQSALGPEIKGEGIVGLTRGFMYAGATTVISSLWIVNDARTATLMKRFYEQMLKFKLKPAAALRNAQKSLYQQGEDPEVWAAFQIQGEWKEPIQIRSPRRSRARLRR